MSYYARVLDGIVVDVIAAEQDFVDALNGSNEFPGVWLKTSYNTYGGQHPEGRPLRKNFAGIGYTYDKARDAFIPPMPPFKCYLDEETCLWVKAEEAE